MLVHPQFDPVAIHLGPLAIRWYALMYLAAFAQVSLLARYRARKNAFLGWQPRALEDVLFYGVLGVIAVGRPTDVAWAMVFPNVDNIPRHPSQLYHAGLDGLALFIVLWIYTMKPRPAGAASALFLIGYGLARSFVEFFRTPDFEISLGPI